MIPGSLDAISSLPSRAVLPVFQVRQAYRPRAGVVKPGLRAAPPTDPTSKDRPSRGTAITATVGPNRTRRVGSTFMAAGAGPESGSEPP
jgi:hypothetical protein